MNKELSLRTLAYLVGYYKTHNETIINLEEIEAINFILDENEQLQQENKQLKEETKRLNNLIGSTTNYYLKTLDKNGSMPDETVEMFNLLEENKR